MDSRITQFLGHADTFTQRTTSLSPAQWACPSACEGWTAQDVLDHVIDTQREVFARHGMDLGARPSGLSCRSLVTQDFLDYCCGVGGYVGLGGDGLTGDLDGDLA